MSGQFGLDYAEVSQLSRRMKAAQRLAPQQIDKWLHEVVGPRLLKAMQEEAPEGSGRLKASLRQVNGAHTVAVGSQGVPYVEFVIKGTRAHEIRPRNGKVLAFKAGGTTIFASVVHHPGTKPNDFMTRAAKRAMKESLAFLPGLTFAQVKNA